MPDKTGSIQSRKEQSINHTAQEAKPKGIAQTVNPGRLIEVTGIRMMGAAFSKD